jgi:hypothetical protein
MGRLTDRTFAIRGSELPTQYQSAGGASSRSRVKKCSLFDFANRLMRTFFDLLTSLLRQRLPLARPVVPAMSND